MLKGNFSKSKFEAGCDEAGRGCLAGPVVAAAVILPKNFKNEILNDSKKLSLNQRNKLRKIIEAEAVSWSIALVDNDEIDKINILNASILAMHKAISSLKITPGFLLIDGNRFKKFTDKTGKEISHKCVIKGDATYLSIAAASVLAKTERDAMMKKYHEEFPQYNWISNKGYGTIVHRRAMFKFGISPLHRKTFRLSGKQLEMEFSK